MQKTTYFNDPLSTKIDLLKYANSPYTCIMAHGMRKYQVMRSTSTR